jgi:hypothetical protein
MKFNQEIFALGLIALGLVILFLGDSIANIGDEVDSVVTNKWTGIISLGIGAYLLLGKSFKLKTREI